MKISKTCSRCGADLTEEYDVFPYFSHDSYSMKYPLCRRCYYTCEYCGDSLEKCSRQRIIEDEGTIFEKHKVICERCWGKSKENMLKQLVSIILSSGTKI